MNILNIKWLFFSILGLLLIGCGLSIFGEAIIIKYKNKENWFLWGTISLVMVNAGLCFLGQAIIEKIKGDS
jgi:hypothetical protein